MAELSELRDLLDADGGKIEEKKVYTAVQAILHHQILYEYTHAAGFAYGLVVGNQSYFKKYFGAMGYSMAIDQRVRMVALVSPEDAYGWRQNRLRKDETLVLLALRHAYEEGIAAGAIDQLGRISITTDELHDKLVFLSGAEPPTEARLDEILKEIQRHGGVRRGERDRVDKVVPLTVQPGIRFLAPDRYIEAIVDWVERRQAGTPVDPDVVAHMSSFLSGEAVGEPPAEGERTAGEPGMDTGTEPTCPDDADDDMDEEE